jgi:hypothetical protein
LSSLICTMARVKRQHVHTRWREHCKEKLVRDHPLIVLDHAPAQRHAFGVAIVLLLRHVRPRVKEPARSSIYS